MNEYETVFKTIADAIRDESLDDEDVDHALYQVEQLIKRATPTKPVITGAKHSLIFMGCPVCKDRTSIVDNFCSNCGQAIDWSNER